jgi:hypothetical protein
MLEQRGTERAITHMEDNNVNVLSTKHKTQGSKKLGLPKESCSNQMQTSHLPIL